MADEKNLVCIQTYKFKTTTSIKCVLYDSFESLPGFQHLCNDKYKISLRRASKPLIIDDIILKDDDIILVKNQDDNVDNGLYSVSYDPDSDYVKLYKYHMDLMDTLVDELSEYDVRAVEKVLIETKTI